MFRDSPLGGQGAGTFEPWWTQRGGAVAIVGNPHSLYFQTLGELGLAGVTLIGALVIGGIGVGALRAPRASGAERTTAAAALAGFLAFAASLALDWMWELTAASVVGFALLGLVAASSNGVRFAAPRWSRAVAVVAAVAVAATQADLLLSAHALNSSEAAAAAGNVDGARSAAKRARTLEPWASAPYLQLALLAEQQGRLRDALDRIHDALVRDRRDWRLWLVAARLERAAGHSDAARRARARTSSLAPHSTAVAGRG